MNIIANVAYTKQSTCLNVSNVHANITVPGLTPGCFEIDCVYGQGTKNEYNTGVPLFKCDKCNDIINDKCCKEDIVS